MSPFLIVTGPPGAGKSTVARIVADVTPHSVLVAGDHFFGFLANGAIEPWLPESAEQNTVVTRAAGRAVGEFVVGGFAVVYDGVIGPWFLDAFAAVAGASEVDYAVLLPPVGVCQQRVATRGRPDFTDLDATADLHRQFANAGIPERHLVRMDAEPEHIAAGVLDARRRGDFRYVVP